MNSSASDTNTSGHADPGRNWHEPPPQPLRKKSWWRLYWATLTLALSGIALTSYNYWFVSSNPPPRFEELATQRIKVLAWQRLSPQLHVRLTNGQNRMVEFPNLSLSRRPYREIPYEAQRQLVGKTCQMWGRPLRASFQDHYQVFTLECGDGIGFSFDQAIKDYTFSFEQGRSSSFKIYFIVYLIGCALFFWAETVRNRKSLQKATS